jgi:hypothetical protein
VEKLDPIPTRMPEGKMADGSALYVPVTLDLLEWVCIQFEITLSLCARGDLYQHERRTKRTQSALSYHSRPVTVNTRKRSGTSTLKQASIPTSSI